MNPHKIAIIICTNNPLYLDECIHYIQHLHVPDGFELDLLTIADAPCITQGYNEGMHSTDAKYKIYLHQDVFLINQYILDHILSIFQSDNKIGLIGMVGYRTIPSSGIMWKAPRCGLIYQRKSGVQPYVRDEHQYEVQSDGYTPVKLIDGLFMATQYDLEWNTEDLDGWDFYDAYQSMNFTENNYKVVVPNNRTPWCVHDDGQILYLKNYDKYRQKFLAKYHAYLDI